MYWSSMTGCANPAATARPSGRTTSDNARSLPDSMKFVVTRPPLPKLGSSIPSARAGGTKPRATPSRMNRKAIFLMTASGLLHREREQLHRRGGDVARQGEIAVRGRACVSGGQDEIRSGEGDCLASIGRAVEVGAEEAR